MQSSGRKMALRKGEQKFKNLWWNLTNVSTNLPASCEREQLPKCNELSIRKFITGPEPVDVDQTQTEHPVRPGRACQSQNCEFLKLRRDGKCWLHCANSLAYLGRKFILGDDFAFLLLGNGKHKINWKFRCATLSIKSGRPVHPPTSPPDFGYKNKFTCQGHIFCLSNFYKNRPTNR